MRIIAIVNSHRNDFTALMQCEHCQDIWKNEFGYDDDYYHRRVIPAMWCKECNKNRAGEEKPQTTGDEG